MYHRMQLIVQNLFVMNISGAVNPYGAPNFNEPSIFGRIDFSFSVMFRRLSFVLSSFSLTIIVIGYSLGRFISVLIHLKNGFKYI